MKDTEPDRGNRFILVVTCFRQTEEIDLWVNVDKIKFVYDLAIGGCLIIMDDDEEIHTKDDAEIILDKFKEPGPKGKPCTATVGKQAISHVIKAKTDDNGAGLFDCPYKNYEAMATPHVFPPDFEFLISCIRIHTTSKEFSLTLFIGSTPYILKLPSDICTEEWHSIEPAKLRLLSMQNFCVQTSPPIRGVRVFLKGFLYRKIG